MKLKKKRLRWALLASALLCQLKTPAAEVVVLPPELQGGTLERMLRQYSGGAPKELSEWQKLLSSTGEMRHSFVPFSDAPAFTSIDEARVIASNSPRFFIGAVPRRNGTVDFEFIDWRRSQLDESGKVRPGEFVFGQVLNVYNAVYGKPPADPMRITVVDKGRKCAMCHQTGGPIFTDRPWLGVTGANSPLGMYLSFAMLTRLTQLAPDPYGKYTPLLSDIGSKFDLDFGDLRGPSKNELSAITLHGFPLFKFRTAFDFDVDVRRGSMLLYTDQLLNALPEYRRPQFIVRLLRATLRSVVYPQNLEYLFIWQQFLEKEYATYLKPGTKLTARHSPVLTDYQPFRDNQELLKTVFGSAGGGYMTGEPVSAFLRLSDWLIKNEASSYPDKEKPTQESRFLPFDPAYESNAGWAALELLSDISKKDINELQARFADREEEFSRLLLGPTFSSLGEAEIFPSRETLLAVLNGEKPMIRVPVAAGQPDDKGDRERRLGEGQRRCLTCHGGETPSAKVMLFNPMDTEAWKTSLAESSKRTKTLNWRKRILEKLEGGEMPPEDADERKDFHVDSPDWKFLIEFLKNEISG